MAKDFISDKQMNTPTFITDSQMGDKGFVEGIIQGSDALKAVAYNSNKLGAGMAGGLANLTEAVGGDSSWSRGVQDWYKQNAKNYDQPDRPILQEAYNPLNYTVVGKGGTLLTSIVGSAFANEGADSATTGKDFDTGKASNQAAIGLAIDPAIKVAKMGWETVSSPVSSTLRTMFGKTGRSPAEIDALQQLAHKYGIDLTPATASGSPALATLEHNINDSATAVFGLRKAVNAERGGMEDAIHGKLNDMGANGSNTNAGEMFSQGVKDIIENETKYYQTTFGKLFANKDKAGNYTVDKYGKVFSIKGAKNEANKIIALAERNPLLKNLPAYRDAKKILDTDDYLSWGDWSSFRTTLGGLTKDGMATGKTSTGMYKQMYSKLEKDLEGTVKHIGGDSGDILDAYKNVIADYRKYKTGLDGQETGSRFMNAVARDKINPESIGHTINSSTLKATSALDAGGWEPKTGLPMAKKTAATDLLMSSKRTGDNADGLSLNKFLKYSDKDGFKKVAEAPNIEPIDELTSKHGVKHDVVTSRVGKPIDDGVNHKLIIDDLREIATAIAKKDSLKNTSKTAMYNQLNWLKANPIAGLMMMAKDGLISSAYRSDMFKKWLSNGAITKKQYAQAIKDIANTTGQASPKKVRATNILLNSKEDDK